MNIIRTNPGSLVRCEHCSGRADWFDADDPVWTKYVCDKHLTVLRPERAGWRGRERAAEEDHWGPWRWVEQSHLESWQRLIADYPGRYEIQNVYSAHLEPMELCLCEFGKIIPQPDRLYRPVHMPGCKRCEEMAAEQVKSYGRRSPTHEELKENEHVE